MSVEPVDSLCASWARWQGHVVNAQFPLGRCIGCSDHSGVFLTESAVLHPPTAAIKLVPTNRALAGSQLPRWKRAGALAHPHLLRMWEWGGCQLDGLPHLYVVMEYADQTLAQLLLHRALTESEAREMLLPILEALAFLHGRGLVQGQLKPANILVVGDQLKLASDTICRPEENTAGTGNLAVHDPADGGGTSSAAGDIWALGATLFEALTRRAPPGLDIASREIVLPADFSPAFRDIVGRCLSGNPLDRPSLTELLAWARNPSSESEPAATSPHRAPAAPEPNAAEAPTALSAPSAPSALAVTPQAAPEPTQPASSTTEPRNARVWMTVLFGALVSVGLIWTGMHLFGTDHTHASTPLRVHVSGSSPPPRPGMAPAAPDLRAAATAKSTAKSTPVPDPVASAAPPSQLHEVIPDVPRNARRTIRGHIKVWVRVVVNQDGSVRAALADVPGSSRYFRRLAIDAAKEWTFPPAEAPSRRLMQVRFDFSRDGTTGHAVALR